MSLGRCQRPVLPALIADHEDMEELILDPSNMALRDNANRYLKDINALVESSDIYVMTMDGNTIAERVETAAKASLIRLYREFDTADHPGWGKVYDRASKEGGQNALEALSYSGDAEQHPVCAAITRYIGVSKKGSEIREHFLAAPYGWPQDAITSGQDQESRRKSGGIGTSLRGSGALPLPARYWRTWKT